MVIKLFKKDNIWASIVMRALLGVVMGSYSSTKYIGLIFLLHLQQYSNIWLLPLRSYIIQHELG